MNDGDSKSIQQIKGKGKQNDAVQRHGANVSTILQSLWVRCRSIFPNATNGKFMESELCFVLYSGIFLWFLYLLYKTID